MLLPDISEFQPNTDLPGIKAINGGAVIMRVGYGARHKDTSFTGHRRAALAADFHFNGLYQYVTANEDITVQARQFVQWVGTLNPGEIPMVDLEEGSGAQLARANMWFEIVDEAYGLTGLALNQRSWLYSGESFAQVASLIPIFNSDRHTWVAAYRSTEPTPPHTLWQSTDGVDGINITTWPGAGRCDTNVTRYTLAELAATAFQPSRP